MPRAQDCGNFKNTFFKSLFRRTCCLCFELFSSSWLHSPHDPWQHYKILVPDCRLLTTCQSKAPFIQFPNAIVEMLLKYKQSLMTVQHR